MRVYPSFNGGRLVLAVLLTGFVGVAQAKTASVDEVRIEGRGAEKSSDAAHQTGPWWQGFGENALSSLQRSAQQRSGTTGSTVASASARAVPLDAQVTVAYVAMRTYNVRWRLAVEMCDSIDRQRQALAASAPTASIGDALATLDERRAKADRFAVALLGQRDTAISALATLTGSTQQATLNELQATLAIRDMPVFDAETPERLPRSVLMARRDVSASQGRVAMGRRFSPEAEHQLVIGTTSLGGWIESASSMRNMSTPVASALPDVQDLISVAAKAETEISADLADLQRRTAETGRWFEIVKTRQLDLEASRRRLQVGAASDNEVIHGYQMLLVTDDELAVSAGELAYAWIRLQSSTGGQAIQARGASDE